MEISVTPSERIRERLSDAHLAQAVQAIQEEGYVVLGDVVEHEHLDILRERMDADSRILMEAQRWGGAGRVAGHLQQGPPPFAPYVFCDIVANPFAIQVTHAILGDGLYNRFYNGNANTPGSGTQPLHMDNPHLWPDWDVAHPPVSLVVNIALVDVSEENGSTELWPGTQRIPRRETRIDAETEARRREVAPPIRANTRKGSLVIREPRVWHRGVPNRSGQVRHMIALIHTVHWFQRPFTLLFNTGCEHAFPADSPLDHNVTFTGKPLEYLTTRTPTIKEE